MSLICDNQEMGNLEIELFDFLSDKVIKQDRHKVFSGKDLPILKWELNVKIQIFYEMKQIYIYFALAFSGNT